MLRPFFFAQREGLRPSPKRKRADDGIRTRDLRFTKPLLYQLALCPFPAFLGVISRPTGQALTAVSAFICTVLRNHLALQFGSVHLSRDRSINDIGGWRKLLAGGVFYGRVRLGRPGFS